MREQIEQALGNCKYQYKCLCVTKNAFEFTEEEQFFIYDEKDTEQPVKIVSSNHIFQLTVNNPNRKLICLTKTDNCLLTDDTRKCDCVLFDDRKLLFVEMKTSTKKGRRQNRKEAIEQLEITISLFKNILNNTNFTLSAVICFHQTEPRIPNVSASTASAIFFDTYKARLEEGNVVEFQ